jgi:hypothetical protein
MKANATTVQHASYNDRVRAQYAGAEARRKLSDLPPALRADATDFAASGLKPTVRNVTRWLRTERGTFGVVEDLVRQILRLQETARAASVV